MPAAPLFDVHDPASDRTVGALLGAPAAAALVGAPTALTTSFTDPGHGPARLLRTALTDLAATPHPPRPPVDPIAHAWARALRTLARTGQTPPPAPALEHTPPRHPLGASWRALTRTPHPAHDPARGSFACTHLVDAVWAASTAAGDEAALYTGALAAARWGASALPLQALRRLSETTSPHTLTVTALTTARGPHPTAWPEHPVLADEPRRLPPFAVPHPLDEKVLLGNLDHLRAHPHTVDAVVSLCRTHPSDAPHLPDADWVRVWLHDRAGANTNLHFTLEEAAGAVAALRSEGKRVLLHCWAGASRTPAVAARYAVAALGAPPLPTLAAMIRTVGGHLDNPSLSRAAAQLSGTDLPDPAATLFPDGVPPRRTELPAPHITG
ncbi:MULTISPECIES: dual specificity protein phosphatase family protein [unclassified Nocardiopsis]|uniref:dual specificity protein phosphatase family protein n=1 Tax=unclassified Nocardiopsis TaxID=2649073 RepID=UPI001356FC37|nr:MULTISPECIES: dual specificity protein phosphatase family protein [unclassified Nocardiopsis]